MLEELLYPVLRGEIMLEDFMKPHGLSINYLAREINVLPGLISEIIHEKRSITADTAEVVTVFRGVSGNLDWLAGQGASLVNEPRNVIANPPMLCRLLTAITGTSTLVDPYSIFQALSPCK